MEAGNVLAIQTVQPQFKITPWSWYITNPRVAIPGIRPIGNRVRVPVCSWYAKILAELYREECPVEIRELAERLDSFDPNDPSIIPVVKQGYPLWPHQEEAVRYVLAAYKAGIRGWGIFAGLGTGKTRMAIAVADTIQALKILVVGPPASVWVWHKQIRQFGVRPYRIIIPDPEVPIAERIRRIEVRLRHCEPPFVVIMNYEAVTSKQFANWAAEQVWDLVIADEAHRFRAHNGKTFQNMLKLRDHSYHRLALTGTPIYHHVWDLWALYQWIAPGVFPMNYFSFVHRYCGGIKGAKKLRPENERELNERMYYAAYRVDESVVKLPEVTTNILTTSLTGEAAELYKATERKFIQDLEAGLLTTSNQLTRLIRLQQITSGFVGLDNGKIKVVGHEKEQLFSEFLDDFPADEPLVVFAQYLYEIDSIRRVCFAHKRNVGEYSGRRKDLKAFQEGKVNILAIEIGCGRESIDLTRARYCVFYSLGFSYGDYDQARKRVHRPGQTRPVIYTFLIVRDTIDEIKMHYRETRGDIIRSVVDELRRNRSVALAE